MLSEPTLWLLHYQGELSIPALVSLSNATASKGQGQLSCSHVLRVHLHLHPQVLAPLCYPGEVQGLISQVLKLVRGEAAQHSVSGCSPDQGDLHELW